MNRIIVLALAALVTTTAAMAQGTFTIRRPVDGSTVREVASIRIPKNSIPDGGYIGVYVNGQFVEATLPDIDGDDYVYKLDTQARKLEDGPAKIEVVLFVDANGKPQVVNRSSVNVKVDNKTSIKIPEEGLKLRYRFTPGVQRVYQFSMNQEVGTISQAQAQLGGRAPTVSTEGMKLRILYATDNAYTVNGERQGLLRIQGLPDKGKDYAMIIPPGETAAKKVTQNELSPLFMRITDVGREVFSSLPIYFGMDLKNGAPPQVDYFPILPLPVLPTKAVKPGDVWNAAYLFGKIDSDKPFEQSSFVQSAPARGEFEGVTWYKGMPCAIIHSTIAAGPEILKNVKNLNKIKGDAANIKLENKLWFAIDRGAVVRMEVSMTQESLVEVGGSGAGAGSPGGNTGGTGGSSGGGKRMGLGTGDDGGGPSVGGGMITDPVGKMFDFRPNVDENGNMTLFQVGRGRGQRGGGGRAGGPGAGGIGGEPGGGEQGSRGAQNPGGNQPGGRFGQRGSGGASGPRKMVMRVRLSYVAELEQ
ncbi:MAG: hypothetical protein JSS66_14065 [Armatimonadetes bacterium]|nr:hypothetical protein [Armatimonadota bacterium]